MESDDLGWAKPHVDEAREAVARGEFITLAEHRARNAERLAALRNSGARRLATTADADTAEIIADLADKASASVADRCKADLDNLYERLELFPKFRTPRTTLGTQVHIFVVLPYIVIYAYAKPNDVVTILHIMHERRKSPLARCEGDHAHHLRLRTAFEGTARASTLRLEAPYSRADLPSKMTDTTTDRPRKCRAPLARTTRHRLRVTRSPSGSRCRRPQPCWC